MNVAIRGGGPGGLYAALLFSRLGHQVTVWERNTPDDTFGFGVVFSDETLTAFELADPPTYAEIVQSFARWGEIDIVYRGRLCTSGGIPGPLSPISTKIPSGSAQVLTDNFLGSPGGRLSIASKALSIRLVQI